MYHGSCKSFLLLVTCLTLCLFAVPVVLCHADGHKGYKHGLMKTGEHRFARNDHAKKGDQGNETTGEMAAWIFGAANFPVALSIILKTCTKFLPPALNFKEPIARFNRRQKKYLMKLHYWLNPLALGIALTHFLLSSCRSTTFPEWGLGIMAVAVLIGLTMKFKLSPASMRQRIYKLHTSPALLIAGVATLLIGHSIVH